MDSNELDPALAQLNAFLANKTPDEQLRDTMNMLIKIAEYDPELLVRVIKERHLGI